MGFFLHILKDHGHLKCQKLRKFLKPFIAKTSQSFKQLIKILSLLNFAFQEIK